YNDVPHFFGQGRTFHTYAGNGLLTLDLSIRSQLQAVPNAGASASTLEPALPMLVSQLVQTSTHTINLRTHFFQADFRQTYRPTQHIEFFFDFREVARNGFRPRPVGTFARENVGPLGDGINEALGVE